MNREEFAKRLEGIQIQEGTDPKILYDNYPQVRESTFSVWIGKC